MTFRGLRGTGLARGPENRSLLLKAPPWSQTRPVDDGFGSLLSCLSGSLYLVIWLKLWRFWPSLHLRTLTPDWNIEDKHVTRTLYIIYVLCPLLLFPFPSLFSFRSFLLRMHHVQGTLGSEVACNHRRTLGTWLLMYLESRDQARQRAWLGGADAPERLSLWLSTITKVLYKTRSSPIR